MKKPYCFTLPLMALIDQTAKSIALVLERYTELIIAKSRKTVIEQLTSLVLAIATLVFVVAQIIP
ncbi:hypothetical protein [Vibrio sp. TRT 29B02]|uniref:hypothetical protein n=1 Tax=Vibrio sp. TRT 29B02 TaxID=3418508 RepID=UPI003CEDF91F